MSKRTWRERFTSKIDHEGDCWIWVGKVLPNGYGRFWFDGKQRYAHRVAYEQFVGPIPNGLVIDHLCRNRGCVNPDHLEPVTHQENCRRGAKGSLVTHCPNNHPLDEANTYVKPNGTRRCRQCNTDLQRQRRAAA